MNQDTILQLFYNPPTNIIKTKQIPLQLGVCATDWLISEHKNAKSTALPAKYEKYWTLSKYLQILLSKQNKNHFIFV